MKTLITTTEVIAALRAHFNIDPNLKITFDHVGSGYTAIVDGLITATNAGTVATNPDFEADVQLAETPKRATRKARTGSGSVAVASNATEQPAVEDEEDTDPILEVLDKPKPTRKTFGKKAKEEEAVPEEVTAEETLEEESAEEADESEPEEELELAIPAPAPKRAFGKKQSVEPSTAPEYEDDAEEPSTAEEIEEAAAKPLVKAFGQRKSVFGSKR